MGQNCNEVSNMNAIQDLGRAAEARDKRNYDEALRIYTALLARSGPDPMLMWATAQIEFALSVVSPDPDDIHGARAVEWITRAIGLDPDKPEYYDALCRISQGTAPPDYERAAWAARRALQIEPNYVPALDNLAWLYGVPENVVPLHEAISCAEHSVRISPAQTRWAALARLYEKAGRTLDQERALTQNLLEWQNTSQQVF